MWKNYLTVAVRNLLRQKVYSLINIAGLAAGMACAVLILLWVQDELSYDRFHQNADQLYRVEQDQHYAEDTYHANVTPFPAGPAFEVEIPEIAVATRYSWNARVLLRCGDKVFFDPIRGVDPAFFRMFSFPFVRGDSQTALDAPHSLVLTESMAEKYFGDVNPLGKTVSINNQHVFTVTGVVENFPENSSLDFEVAVPFAFLRELGWWSDDWERSSITTFVQLRENAAVRDADEKLTALARSRGEDYSSTEFMLAPLTRIHLHSHSGFGRPMGDIQYVYIFSAIALFVLLTACINFMNLSTARSARRAREIGLRKVVGASRGSMVGQFLGESVLYACLALLVALPLVEFLLPVFNELSGKTIKLDFAYRIDLEWPIFLLAGGVALAVAWTTVGFQAVKAALTNPVEALRYE